MSSFDTASEDVIAALKSATRNVLPPLILYGFGSGTTAIFRALSTLEDIRQTGDGNDDAVKDAAKWLDQIAAVMADSPARDSDAFIFSTVEQDSNPLMFWLPYTTPYAIRLSAGSGDKQDYFAWFSSLSYPVMLFGHAHDDYLEESDYRPMIDERFRIHPDRTSAHFLEGSGHLSSLEDRGLSFYQLPHRWLYKIGTAYDEKMIFIIIAIALISYHVRCNHSLTRKDPLMNAIFTAPIAQNEPLHDYSTVPGTRLASSGACPPVIHCGRSPDHHWR